MHAISAEQVFKTVNEVLSAPVRDGRLIASRPGPG